VRVLSHRPAGAAEDAHSRAARTLVHRSTAGSLCGACVSVPTGIKRGNTARLHRGRPTWRWEPAILVRVSLLRRVFGSRRYERPEPGPQDIARVDVPRMIATARERGDRRTDPEVVAALVLGADLTAERHRDSDMRLRGAAAFEACRRWLVEHVGEDEAARLLTESEGPVDEQGRMVRPP
jgi:hypothetical protein